MYSTTAFFFFFLKATKSIDGTEKSIPPKKHLQEVPRTLVRVSREGESTCQTLRSHSSDRATSPRLSISRNSDLDDVDKDPHILITRYFLSKRLGALLTIGHSYRAIGHTGLVPKRSIDPESASGDPSVFSFGITCGRLGSCYSDAPRTPGTEEARCGRKGKQAVWRFFSRPAVGDLQPTRILYFTLRGQRQAFSPTVKYTLTADSSSLLSRLMFNYTYVSSTHPWSVTGRWKKSCPGTLGSALRWEGIHVRSFVNSTHS